MDEERRAEKKKTMEKNKNSRNNIKVQKGIEVFQFQARVLAGYWTREEKEQNKRKKRETQKRSTNRTNDERRLCANTCAKRVQMRQRLGCVNNPLVEVASRLDI